MFRNVVVVLRVGLHGDLGVAACALEVEPKYFDAQVFIVVASLLAHVEFRPYVQKVAASVTTYTHRKHHTHIILLVFSLLDLGQLGRVEIRRIVLI